MKVNWIIEKYMFEEYEQQLVDTIKNSGHNALVVDDTHWKFDFDRDIKSKFTEDQCVLFYGSLQRGRQLWCDTNFVPGVFLTIDNYECFKYYGYYGDELVNSHYTLLGLNDVFRNKEKLFEILHEAHWTHLTNSKIFIRPSNGYKTFTGQLLSWKNFDEEFSVFCKSYGGLDMNQLVLIAPEQRVREENRFIIINENGKNRIVDGNKYMVDREVITERIVDEEAWKYAETVKDNYTPDKAFTIDIAKLDDGTYKVLEIGSFCCAGWYNINLEKVVNQMNNLCINEYNDYYNL
jgi:hypothetical protein